MAVRHALLGALVGVLAAGPALGEPFDLGAPEGAETTIRVARDFDRYDLPIGWFAPGTLSLRPIEGEILWTAHRLDDEGISVAAVMQAYRDRLKDAGWETILDCANDECGGFDFRFGAAILPPPGMRVDTGDFAQLSAAEPGGARHASVLISRVLGTVYIQTVATAGSDPGIELSDTPDDAETLPESDGAILPQQEKQLYDGLIERGHVRVDGLDFETGGAALSRGSDEALDLLARMLQRNADLSVLIVGHSDNEGALEANVALSQLRATAVMEALLARGVSESQLSARGVGFLAPVASNGTPEGRARNRRVELVLR